MNHSQLATIAAAWAALLLQVARGNDDWIPCSVCPNPADTYDPALSEKKAQAPGFGEVTCSFLEEIIPLYLEQDNERCTILQSLGTYCGCPKAPGSCPGLCEEYDRTAIVPDFAICDGWDLPCELAQNYLDSFPDGSDDCAELTALFGGHCGCGGEVNTSTDNNIFDSEKDGEDVFAGDFFAPFSLCPDGSEPAFPDKDLTFLMETGVSSTNPAISYGADELGDKPLTCSFLDQLAKAGLVQPSEVTGTEDLRVVAGFCGCPPVANACSFCPSNDITKPDRVFPLTQVVFDIMATCDQVDEMLSQYENTDLRCWSSKNFAFLCGCNEGTAWYLGADSEAEHKTLAWIPRITGFLSFLGSVYIIQDIVRQSRKSSIGNKFSTYQMILLGMSLFDLSSSIAWMISTAALPSYDEERESESGVYGAKGNEATCKAQGFFLELGFVGSTAFTAILTSFYVLTIIYGYREAKMKPLQKYFMTGPPMLAVALASAAIPYYRPFYVACLVSNPNTEVDRYADEWRYLVIFSILPIGIAILISVCNLAAILRFVIKQNQRANKWRFDTQGSKFTGSNSQTNSNETFPPSSEMTQNLQDRKSRKRAPRSKAEIAVFWQAFWYVMAFLLTWMVYLIGQFKPYFSSDDEHLYSFWITLLFLNPLMGFWNAFVYVKPWTWKWENKLLCRLPLISKGGASSSQQAYPNSLEKNLPESSQSQKGTSSSDDKSSHLLSKPVDDHNIGVIEEGVEEWEQEPDEERSTDVGQEQESSTMDDCPTSSAGEDEITMSDDNETSIMLSQQRSDHLHDDTSEKE